MGNGKSRGKRFCQKQNGPSSEEHVTKRDSFGKRQKKGSSKEKGHQSRRATVGSDREHPLGNKKGHQ
jgi:hypothetical protein